MQRTRACAERNTSTGRPQCSYPTEELTWGKVLRDSHPAQKLPNSCQAWDTCCSVGHRHRLWCGSDLTPRLYVCVHRWLLGRALSEAPWSKWLIWTHLPTEQAEGSEALDTDSGVKGVTWKCVAEMGPAAKESPSEPPCQCQGLGTWLGCHRGMGMPGACSLGLQGKANEMPGASTYRTQSRRTGHRRSRPQE